MLAVFATMYVRDHARPAFHKALGIDPTDYDMRVFRTTQDIMRQVFPVTLDLDHPAFLPGLERLRAINEAANSLEGHSGLLARFKRSTLAVRAAGVFVRLYLITPKTNALPSSSRLQPSW